MKKFYLTLFLSATLAACGGGSSGGGGAPDDDGSDNNNGGGTPGDNVDQGYGTILENQSITILVNDTATINYRANKTVDPDDIVMVTEVQNGGSNIYADHFFYRPDNDYSGTDSLSYKLCNSDNKCSNTATISITISTQPQTEYGTVLDNQTINMIKNDTINISYVADKAVDHNDVVVISPTRGTLVTNSTYFTYTADSGSLMPDVIDYKLCNSAGLCTETARITIIISEPTDSYPTLSVQVLSDVSKDGNVIIHGVLNNSTYNYDFSIYDNKGSQRSTPLLVNQSGGTINCLGNGTDSKDIDMDLSANGFAVMCGDLKNTTDLKDKIYYYNRTDKVMIDLVEMAGDTPPPSDSSRAKTPFISDDGNSVIFYSNYDSINPLDSDNAVIPGIFHYDVATGVRRRIETTYGDLLTTNSDLSKAMFLTQRYYSSPYELQIIDIATGAIDSFYEYTSDNVMKVVMTDDATKFVSLQFNDVTGKYELKAYNGSSSNVVLELDVDDINLELAMDKTAENVVLSVHVDNTLGKVQGLYKVNIASKVWTQIAATEEGHEGLFTDSEFTKAFSYNGYTSTLRVDEIN